MESENFEDIKESFNRIDIEDEPGSEKNDIYARHSFKYYYKPKPILRYIPPKRVDLEQYIIENCDNKLQILNREIFPQIKRPTVIFFNHFQEKCAHHTKWLDTMYQLALKYGERIEFIVADLIDMDIIYPGRNPLNFFCRLVSPEDETPNTFFIDEKKRIYQYFDAYKTVDSLLEVCENLLEGKLFPSLPIPKKLNLVKVCVYDNYEELILKSKKNIFLIVNLEIAQQFDPNYEFVADALKDQNLDVVYMEAEKNYIPFEYSVNGYPSILYIPCDDKNNFVYYEGERREDAIIEFLKNIMEKPEFLKSKQQVLKTRMSQKIFNVSNDFEIDFNDLPKLFQDNFNNRIKVLDRKILEKEKRLYIIAFMDFLNMKCRVEHIEWFNKIFQVAESSYTFQFCVADFKDIDVIHTKWKPAEVKALAQGKPRIYSIDYLKHTYEFGNFDSAAALFYFSLSLQRRQLYYSQLYSKQNVNEKVKEWTADLFNIFLKNCKKHVFITFYSSEDKNTEKLSNILNEVADYVDDLNIEMVKFDAFLNYVDLEFAQDNYPVHYFIPKHNKRVNKLYINKDFRSDKMVEFIKMNLVTN